MEDAVQETLRRGIEPRSTFAYRASFQSFLIGIACNVAREQYRDNARVRSFVPCPPEELTDPGAAPDETLVLREQIERLEAALEELPALFLVPLRMYYWDQLKPGQIARSLGVPENTVRSRLNRGRQRLKRAFDAAEEMPVVR